MGLFDDIRRARESATRLAAVHATGLLDRPAAEPLDRLTRLAARMLGVPAAFISIVDEGRDFYPSHCGFSGELAESRELHGDTFCHLTLLGDDPVVIDDTHVDPAHRRIPTVDSLDVRAYLGVPMRSTGGERVGSFCAIDYAPRRWSERDVEVMRELALSAMRELTLMSAVGEHLRAADVAHLARREAEENARARQQVLNAVSHDLRTPLGTFVLALAAIEPAVTEPRALRSLAIARRQAAQMKVMLDDLLENARFAEGLVRLAPAPVALADILDDVAGNFEGPAESAGITLEVSCAPDLRPAMVDRSRIEQVLANIVSNALKFTPRGGAVSVTGDHEGDRLRVEVSDTGAGIEPALVEKVFEPYWQADPRAPSGVGLGLHIARGIVELHGGRISVRSDPGKGTTFAFDLPCGERPTTAR